MGPNELTNTAELAEQIVRVTHCSMLTSEQTSVVCATLSLLSSPATVVSMMLVEGEAGTGKSATLLETAFECVIAKPTQSVLIFCKWSEAADLMAFSLLGESHDFSLQPRVLIFALLSDMSNLSVNVFGSSLQILFTGRS